VPEDCSLTLHGVGADPLQPITVRALPAPAPAPGGQTTRHAHDRRGVEGKVQVSVGPRSANAEGEDQLWRHALEEVSRSADANFLAFISDTDFKEAALVLLPRRLFPDGAALPTGHIFVASIDRSAPQTQQYWCMNELITAVARSPALADGIPGGPAPLVRTLAAAQRLRCGHLAAALVLMGGDTTPSIHGLTEQAGVSLVCTWAWYTGPLVEAYTHHLSGLEVFKLIPEAVLRLHKVWYVLRSTPNIQKELKYNAQRGREAQRAWFDGWTLEQIATKVIDKVPPVGVAGQPVRTAANLLILTTVANARLLQWGLAPCPDASLFAARDGLRAVDGGQCGPWNTELDWDLTEVGKKAPGPRAGPVATPAKLSALELFRKYQNDLRGVDTLPQTERRALLVGQLLARGGDASDFKGKSWQQVKRLLLAALNSEAPPSGAAAAPQAAAPAGTGAAAPATLDTNVEMIDAAPAAAANQPEVPADAEIPDTVADAADDNDPADASSSDDEDDEADEAAPVVRQPFFCCTDEKKAGGFWWCPGCSKCFHNACDASATQDGSNKVCEPCHARMMSSSDRVTRRRTR
jgi:hypothetical protein